MAGLPRLEEGGGGGHSWDINPLPKKSCRNGNFFGDSQVPEKLKSDFYLYAAKGGFVFIKEMDG